MNKKKEKNPRHLVGVEVKNFFLGGGEYKNHLRMSSNLWVPDSLLSVSPPLSIAGVIFTPVRDKSMDPLWTRSGVPMDSRRQKNLVSMEKVRTFAADINQ